MLQILDKLCPCSLQAMSITCVYLAVSIPMYQLYILQSVCCRSTHIHYLYLHMCLFKCLIARHKVTDGGAVHVGNKLAQWHTVDLWDLSWLGVCYGPLFIKAWWQGFHMRCAETWTLQTWWQLAGLRRYISSSLWLTMVLEFVCNRFTHTELVRNVGNYSSE